MIHTSTSKLHWNYFIALEHDLEIVSRYVEFCKPNFKVYSIELAHLLFAAASEVDVVAKLLCERVHPGTPCDNINDYRAILLSAFPDMSTTQVFLPRYGLTLTPWDDWAVHNPFWWRGYNRVKHERDAHFNEATLEHALNALAALFIFTFHYYSFSLAPGGGPQLSPRETTRALFPESTLLRFSGDHYYSHLIFE